MSDELKWAENIYNSQIEEIRFAKKQQWKTAYYTLLILSAIYYIKENDLIYNNKWMVMALTFVLIFVSLFIIWNIHLNIMGARLIIIRIRQQYPEIAKLAGISSQDENKEKAFTYNIEIIITFHITILSAAVLIIKTYQRDIDINKIIIYLSLLSAIIPFWVYINYLDKSKINK